MSNSEFNFKNDRGGEIMVMLDPRNKQIICNKCEKQIGFFDDKGEFTQSEDTDTFMRLRIYDVDYLDRRLSKQEYEVDFCDTCLKAWEKIIKKFKMTCSPVRPLESTAKMEGT